MSLIAPRGGIRDLSGSSLKYNLLGNNTTAKYLTGNLAECRDFASTPQLRLSNACISSIKRVHQPFGFQHGVCTAGNGRAAIHDLDAFANHLLNHWAQRRKVCTAQYQDIDLFAEQRLQ